METLNGKRYLAMICGGAARLDASRQEINNLNVFPIPDGDTGDNMYMTIASKQMPGKSGELCFFCIFARLLISRK